MGLSTNSSVSHRRGGKGDMHVSLLEARLLKTKEFSASSETNSSHSEDFLHSGQDGTADARKHLVSPPDLILLRGVSKTGWREAGIWWVSGLGGTGYRIFHVCVMRTRGQTGLPANFRQSQPEIHGSLVSPRK